MATSTINQNLSKEAENQENTGSNRSSTQGLTGDQTKGTSEVSTVSAPTSSSAPRKDSVRIVTREETKKNKKLLIPIIIGVLLLIGLSAYFFVIKKPNYVDPFGKSDEANSNTDNPVPSTKNEGFENPINGVFYSNEEATKFKDRKPVAIMVNNYVEARPSSGLSKADIIFEAVAEAGITRLMPIFYSQSPETVGSIRSARYYFAELATPYSPHYIHWGAAHVPACQKEPATSAKYCPPVGGKVETNPLVDAYDRIVELGLPNLDGGNYSCDQPTCAFGRDPKKVGKMPLEHTAFVRFPLLFQKAKEIRPEANWHIFQPITPKWTFKDDEAKDKRGTIGATTPITYDYSNYPGFNVSWKYNPETNTYVRSQGGVVQKDFENNQDLVAKVIIIRFTEQESANDKKGHLIHKIVGTNKALVFQDGKVTQGTWSRTTHDENDVYKDSQGKEIAFDRGQIWVQLVPSGNIVNYSESSTPAPAN